jgi:hypothetical protein
MKQIGHSAASLYKTASRGEPLTRGSRGKRISWGAIEVDEALLFLFEVPKDASVFARSRKRPRDAEPEGRDAVPGRGKVAL